MDTENRWFADWMEGHQASIRSLSRRIWNFAETGMEETQSAQALCQALEEHGFQVERGLGGIDTAFVGRYGSGKPVIGFLGEFDALEGLSQKAGSCVQEPVIPGGNGHGCGHNLLGCGALAAAAALKDYMEQYHLPGTVCYYGCPGEEKGCGKVRMAESGYFRELDAALTWHPEDSTQIEGRGSLADLCMEIQFTGTSAHASTCPHQGRSALDALELLNIACNFLREHMVPDARIHYAITDTGGVAPNIIPAHAAGLYEARAPQLAQAEELRDRIVRAAQGAALMTDTEVKVIMGDCYSDFRPNHRLNQVAWEAMRRVGAPAFTSEDETLAKALQQTFPAADSPALRRDLIPYTGVGGYLPASTDVGNVSHLIPTLQIYTASCACGTPGHSWQMVSQAGGGIGEAGMFTAARVLALTALTLLKEPTVLEEAWAEFRR